MPHANSHAALMRWKEDDLAGLAHDNARKLGEKVSLAGLDKRGIAHLVISQAKRLSAREGRQGE